MMIKWLLYVFILSGPFTILNAQFPPPAGQPGTTAIYKDSSIFRTWADKCDIETGYINLVDTTVVFQGSNKANWGFPEDAVGPPDNFVVSLGDQGIATLTLPGLMFDSIGPDFAVFENSFSDSFLELGFVEVSSNGIEFVRFPGISLTQDTSQISTFDTLDATKINNLAGKYRVFYGTPFDLSDLKDSSSVDISAVSHIRIRDVGGCIQPGYQSFDAQGHIINDPWPTPFNSCGLDLDAVGIVHINTQSVQPFETKLSLWLYPNPVSNKLGIVYPSHSVLKFTITDLPGNIILTQEASFIQDELDISALQPGIYILVITLRDYSLTSRKFIKI